MLAIDSLLASLKWCTGRVIALHDVPLAMSLFGRPSLALRGLRDGHAWVALLLGVLASAFVGQQVKNASEREALRQFAFICDQVSLRISERLCRRK